ncbi:MAG: fused MFS/spermidine synthase [Actinomycetota bacterium]|nr:fused MFS/spermidine synthase [Actinomycetota bacterium]
MNRSAAGALVFCTSAAVLVLEILAARLLTPYVGVTLETYTAVIGTVLAGIATGTWVGGRLADVVHPRALLGPLLALGGALSLATVPLVRLVGATVAGRPEGVVPLSVVGFFAPAAVLSAVTPTVVKLQLRDLAVTGRVVGRLSALGTAGAIVGTFVAGFVLVEAAPTTTSILVIGGLLMVAGVIVWVRVGRAGTRGVAVVAVVGLVGASLGSVAGNPCHVETEYQCARVVPDEDRPGGRSLFLGTLRHSYVDLDDPTYLEFRYTKVFADVMAAAAPPGALDVLHLGAGGFTMPRYLRAVRAGSTSTVLEIDPALVELARERLGLRMGPDLDVRVGDARLLVGDLPEASQDVVLGDAFGGLAVPWHLTTVEFARAVRAVLRPDGVYVINLVDYRDLRFARAEVATLFRVFGHVAVVAPPSVLEGGGGNVVVVASDVPIDAAAVGARVVARQGEERVLAGAAAVAFAGRAPVLTDDYAPVDQWLARARLR